MTASELSKLYYIKKLIDRDALRLAKLEARIQPHGMNMSGMPKNPSPKNNIEETIPLIVGIRERIICEQENYINEQLFIEEYINTVEDYHIRLILSYRFVDLMSWNQIAMKIGGNNTADSVRKACNRFLRKSEET